jgi:D-tyrosyl-tRNA(Tyr) deacylase
MRAVLQRVSRAAVSVGGETVGAIERGLLALLAVETGDTGAEVAWIAKKIAELRIFEDGAGKMNLSVTEIGGSVLLVSQFTLAADCRKGRRPSFDRAAAPADATPLFAAVRASLEASGLCVAEGRFGAHMRVELVNDGPVTIVLDRRAGDGRSEESTPGLDAGRGAQQ